MAKGKAKRVLLGIQGLIGHRKAPDWDFIYRVSSVRDPKWNIGDPVELPDGRKFRYCLSAGVCNTYQGNIFCNSIGTGASDEGVDWSAVASTVAVGDKSILVTLPSTRNIAEDSLRGGLAVFNISSGTNNDTIQQRLIVGNTAGVASGTMTVYLDAAFVTILTSGTAYVYLMPSPYSAIQGAHLASYPGKASFVGYAAAPVNAASLYHWEQTAGQISASVYGAAVGKTQYMREVVFRHDGNLIHRGASGVTGLEAQTAGYIMDNNYTDNGATVINLTGLES